MTSESQSASTHSIHPVITFRYSTWRCCTGRGWASFRGGQVGRNITARGRLQSMPSPGFPVQDGPDTLDINYESPSH